MVSSSLPLPVITEFSTGIARDRHTDGARAMATQAFASGSADNNPRVPIGRYERLWTED